MGVKDFHDFLFRHAKQGVARFPNLFAEKVNPPRLSLQFSYTFLSQGAILDGVDGVVVFEHDDSFGRFRSLRIEFTTRRSFDDFWKWKTSSFQIVKRRSGSIATRATMSWMRTASRLALRECPSSGTSAHHRRKREWVTAFFEDKCDWRQLSRKGWKKRVRLP